MQRLYRLRHGIDATLPSGLAAHAQAACNSLLQAVTQMPGVALTWAFTYVPDAPDLNPKDRLKMFISIRGHEQPVENLVQSLELSALAPLFSPTGRVATRRELTGFKAVCDLARRELIERPDVPDRFSSPTAANPYLQLYYLVDPFEANPQNTWEPLDRALDRARRPMLIHAAVEPVDPAAERRAVQRYRNQLTAIGRGYSEAEDAERGLLEYGQADRAWSEQMRLRYRDPRAADIVKGITRLRDALQLPTRLRWHLRIFAASQADAQGVAREVGACVFADDSWTTVIGEYSAAEARQLLHRCVSGEVIPCPSRLQREYPEDAAQLGPLATAASVASPDELAGTLQIPTSSQPWFNCMRLEAPAADDKEVVQIGREENWRDPATSLRWQGRAPAEFPKADLKRGTGCFGTTGSGKTSGLLHLIDNAGTNFVLAELTKREWRGVALAYNGQGTPVQILTPGKESLSPFRINPAEIYPGESAVMVQEELSTMLGAGLALENPGPSVLKQAIAAVFRHRDPSNPPLLSEIRREAWRTVDAMGYDAETRSNIQAMVDNRLHLMTSGTIGRVFQCRRSNPPIAELLESRTIIEMDELAEDQASFLAFVLMRCLERYVRSATYA